MERQQVAKIPNYADEAAFPRAAQYHEPKPDEVLLPAQWGLTKRELIAAMAMQGFCANPAVFAPNPINGWQLVNCSDETLNKICISHADALLAALAKVQS